MRILVTGATGFVGRWLIRELEETGHDAVPAPGSAELEITDEGAVSGLVNDVRPDAIAHLAGVSHAKDAALDPDRAFAVNEGGTRAVMEAAAMHAIPVLVSGSAEVYGRPRPGDLPLREDVPLRTDQPYGVSKVAQERTALEIAARGVPVVVTRSFNHTGPGQRREFVAPALAYGLIEAKRTARPDVAVGDLEVRRDIGDVRDVVRAYRLLLEGLAEGSVPAGTVVNVATGTAVKIRWVFDVIARILGMAAQPRIDPSLLRVGEAPLIVGDPARLQGLTGWFPAISLERTLTDLVASLDDAREGIS
jgi:GDP-4-dehydro-6-deoxy-D-mannose reductase